MQPWGEIVDRIAAAPGRMVLLRGPAASGKTSACLEFYRRHIGAEAQVGCLLLAPNSFTREALRRRLLEESPHRVIVGPRVQTFAALASAVLAAAGHPAKPLPAFQRHLMLRAIVSDLAKAGALTSLAGVADTPGIVEALDRSIAELKRAAAEPEMLAAAIGNVPGKDRDILEVYRRYQATLHATASYDIEGLMWQFRDCLLALPESAPLPGLGGVRAVAADGFTDFTPTQLGVLSLLGRRLERVLVTLPLGDDSRTRMWHWTARTAAACRGHLALAQTPGPKRGRDALETRGQDARGTSRSDLCEISLAAPAAPAPLLRLAHSVFDIDAPARPLPEGLRLIAAAGIDAEVAAVARQVKALLVGGAPAGSIAVLARSMEPYRPPIDRIFAEHEIPVVPAGSPLASSPVARFVLDVAALPAGDFGSADVLRVIKSSYFRPEAIGAFTERHRAAAEMIIRQGNVLRSAEAYRAAAQRLARAPRGRQSEDDVTIELGALTFTPEEVSAAGAMIDSLLAISSAAATKRGLVDLIRILGLATTAAAHDEPALIARDLAALGALDRALADLPEPLPSLADIRLALATMQAPSARGEAVVDVLDVLDARAMRWQHVFLVGLTQHSFPPRQSEGSLIGQPQRAAWEARGITLDSRTDLAAREMLLFYLAASRADSSLTLSYTHSDASGGPQAASHFLQALLAPVGGLEALERAGRVERIVPGQLVPQPQAIASPRDALNAGVAGLFDATLPSAGAALAWAARCRGELLARAARGIWARARRWSDAPPDEFDGAITDPHLTAVLRRRYPAEQVFSASQFNAYLQCRWRFFAQYVLRLEPLPEPTRKLEPVERGIFVHNVLWRLLTHLRDAVGRPLPLGSLPENLDAEIQRAIEIESRRLPPPPYPALWNVQLARIARDLADYLARCRCLGQELAAAATHFELGFGVGDYAELCDAASAREPVEIATPAGPIALRGKIDRVDRIEFNGLSGSLVVDYKTGHLPADKDLTQGRNVQLALYAQAVSALVGQPSVGGAFHRIGDADGYGARFFAAVKPERGGGLARNDDFAAQMASAMTAVARSVQGMAAGDFSLAPEACASFCPFRQICHYSEHRADLKAPAEASHE